VVAADHHLGAGVPQLLRHPADGLRRSATRRAVCSPGRAPVAEALPPAAPAARFRSRRLVRSAVATLRVREDPGARSALASAGSARRVPLAGNISTSRREATVFVGPSPQRVTARRTPISLRGSRDRPSAAPTALRAGAGEEGDGEVAAPCRSWSPLSRNTGPRRARTGDLGFLSEALGLPGWVRLEPAALHGAVQARRRSPG